MNPFQSRRHRITRDYWKITALLPFHGPPTITVQGRLRKHELFWPGLVVLECDIGLLANELIEAVSYMRECLSVPKPEYLPMYPSMNCCALYRGSDYIIEMSEYVNALDRHEIATTVINTESTPKPAVQLIGEDLEQFARDFTAASEWIEQKASDTTTGMLIGVL